MYQDSNQSIKIFTAFIEPKKINWRN